PFSNFSQISTTQGYPLSLANAKTLFPSARLATPLKSAPWRTSKLMSGARLGQHLTALNSAVSPPPSASPLQPSTLAPPSSRTPAAPSHPNSTATSSGVLPCRFLTSAKTP